MRSSPAGIRTCCTRPTEVTGTRRAGPCVDRDRRRPPRVPRHRAHQGRRFGSLHTHLLGLRRAREHLHRQPATAHRDSRQRLGRASQREHGVPLGEARHAPCSGHDGRGQRPVELVEMAGRRDDHPLRGQRAVGGDREPDPRTARARASSRRPSRPGRGRAGPSAWSRRAPGGRRAPPCRWAPDVPEGGSHASAQPTLRSTTTPPDRPEGRDGPPGRRGRRCR